MSTILKALRRLEEDKKTRAAMSLDSALLEPSKGPRKQSQLGVSIAAGVVAAIGMSAILWSLSSFWMPAAPETAAVAPAPSGIPAEPTPPTRITVPIAEAPRPAPGEPVPLAGSSADSRMQVLANAGAVQRETQRAVVAPDELRVPADAALRDASAGEPAPSTRAPAPAKTAPPVRQTTLARKIPAAEPSPQAAVPGSAEKSVSVATGTPAVPTSSKAQTAASASARSEQEKQETKVASRSPASKPVVESPVAGAQKSASGAAPVREVETKRARPEPATQAATQSEARLDTKPRAETVAEARAPSSAPLSAGASAAPGSAAQLAVRQIIWHPTPSRRVAVFAVEGDSVPQRIGEGGVVGGFTVAKIGLSDVELVRDGVAVVRRVGAN
jgi:hypothetical protein